MKNQSISIALVCFFALTLFAPINTSAKTALHRVNFSIDELKNIQGHYSSIYGHIFIRVKGRHVSTRFDGKYIELIKKSNGHIYPRYKFLWVFPLSLGNASFTMKKSRSGEIRVLMHKQKKAKIIAQKFTANAVTPVWKRRLGIYKAKRIKGKSTINQVRLALQNGVLVAFINQLKSPYPLVAHSNTQLTSPSAGHNNNRTIKIFITKNSILLEYENNKLALKKQ